MVKGEPKSKVMKYNTIWSEPIWCSRNTPNIVNRAYIWLKLVSLVNDYICTVKILYSECIFFHKDTGVYKYSVVCERNYCMYKHNDDKPDESEECGNRTFQNPSQFEQNSSDEKFQCNWCDFLSEKKSDLEKHQELSKVWCTVCSENWGCEDNLKSHLEISHQKQRKDWLDSTPGSCLSSTSTTLRPGGRWEVWQGT